MYIIMTDYCFVYLFILWADVIEVAMTSSMILWRHRGSEDRHYPTGSAASLFLSPEVVEDTAKSTSFDEEWPSSYRVDVVYGLRPSSRRSTILGRRCRAGPTPHLPRRPSQWWPGRRTLKSTVGLQLVNHVTVWQVNPTLAYKSQRARAVLPSGAVQNVLLWKTWLFLNCVEHVLMCC